ncbi:helix-turn-helix transcriptional regulator [Actibacterium sp. 188UL27-1]|uniref:helix-turn-helix transcriptional regulator n=1 Tax=Actibacterium sp. 188UL27-1 TaxID=2786961 RepID=UPI00195C6FF9|nr:AraC family transcriptional regulator [Actibacterium sp. 188UL27-1]MBM7069048.1 helix-turn-helix transcriptional regulator [Actibacterium sp. 188UL27-1]
MSQAIAVCHGEFGRAARYRLDKTIITHAHRKGHLIFHVDGGNARVPNGDVCLVTASKAVAVSPWEPHGFCVEDGRENICLVLYIKPMWFLENSSSGEFALKFGRPDLTVTPEITGFVNRLTALLFDSEEQTCFDQSWSNASGDRRAKSYNRFSDFRVRRALRLIQDKIGEDFEMENLAGSVGLSHPHFFKLFKQYMGVTPTCT